MGYDNEFASAACSGKPWLVFDVETCPMPDCGEYLVEPIEAPANYKDPVKIAAYIAEKRQRQIEAAALDLDLCEVVAVAWHDTHMGDRCYTRADGSERDMLEAFWCAVGNGRWLAGFNCLHFDLPVLQRRSLYLGLYAPQLSLDKYRHDGIVDVADLLSYGGRMTWRSLAFYAKRFGIPYDDRVKGEDIPRLVADGQWDAIAEHVRGDVATTAALARRIGVLPSVLAQPIEQQEVVL